MPKQIEEGNQMECNPFSNYYVKHRKQHKNKKSQEKSPIWSPKSVKRCKTTYEKSKRTFSLYTSLNKENLLTTEMYELSKYKSPKLKTHLSSSSSSILSVFSASGSNPDSRILSSWRFSWPWNFSNLAWILVEIPIPLCTKGLKGNTDDGTKLVEVGSFGTDLK